MNELREEATKNWCPKCEYYKTQKCEDWSISESSICDAGYLEWLEQQLTSDH